MAGETSDRWRRCSDCTGESGDIGAGAQLGAEVCHRGLTAINAYYPTLQLSLQSVAFFVVLGVANR